MINVKNADDLQKIIASRGCVIYGAGYVAQRFFKALKRQGLGKQVRSFITSSLPTITEIDNIPVQSIEALNQYINPLILIAVHEALVSQIEATLLEKGYGEYIWIYPFLYEIMLGKPTIDMVDLKTIMRANNNNIALYARYLTIEQYYGKNDYGYEIYKKTVHLFNPTLEVVEKRLKNFIKLIKSWEKNGYDSSKAVTILENGLIIDGSHRISLALYHNLEKMKCNVYPATVSYSEIHNLAVIPKIDDLHILGFTQFEQSVIIDVSNRIDGGVI